MSVQGVACHRRRLPNQKQAVALRICLGCDEPFRSDGPWNRFCDKCRRRNEGVADPADNFPKALRLSRKPKRADYE